MRWNLRYWIGSYVRSSLWIIPIGALLFEQVFAFVLYAIDARLGWSAIRFREQGARGMLEAIITLTLSFTVFTFGSLLVAIQVASGQYTPRIIATTLLRNNVIRYTVGLFVFTFVFQVRSLDRMQPPLPQFVLFVDGLLGLTCIAAFLFLIDYAARLLRPVSLVRCVGEDGLAVLNRVYPDTLTDEQNPEPVETDLGPITRTILHDSGSGIVVAVNVPELMAQAEKTGGIIEFAPQVGDFVGRGEPLFLLHGNAATVNDDEARACVAFGPERTLEQDPLFAFRILVDIAIKALSAAINDPTTAVLAIDQLNRLLRRAGGRNLRTDFNLNGAGHLVVVVRTPNWSDFVHLAFTEIRSYGAGNIQIARRLRAMITNVANALPPVRQPVLREELDLLDRALQRIYTQPEDLALARIPDPQGLGGSAGTDRARWAA